MPGFDKPLVAGLARHAGALSTVVAVEPVKPCTFQQGLHVHTCHVFACILECESIVINQDTLLS